VSPVRIKSPSAAPFVSETCRYADSEMSERLGGISELQRQMNRCLSKGGALVMLTGPALYAPKKSSGEPKIKPPALVYYFYFYFILFF
jgi:hypothetical protein